ncbi:MAG: transketolase [Pseudomonadota bacterium]|nr:transketolase [Pseudomonadota bacterium]
MKNTLDVDNLRKTVLEMAFKGSTVHIACSFSIIEILAVIYRSHLNYDFNKMDDPLRDYLILSKGHGVMAQYACIRELGWISDEDIDNYCGDETILKGLSDSRVPGLEVSSGSLGHGISVAMGLAWAAKKNQTNQKTYVILGDGELNEGSCWEAIMFAGHHKLDNLIIIVDKNNFQATAKTEEVINQENLSSRIESFGFDVLSVNGHDEQELDSAIQQLFQSKTSRPKAIVANTVKGYGISFMEDSNDWHYKRLDSETYEAALKELELRK